ncbi:3-hydroxyisobutyrate dehydrogenase [Dysgonomonas alginatilytica]|uniref:3-hydroxyisobutyrate dehydrogenase n=1 Tax=Dysgonomonas alginatilytica TaxID=1605892 RepID=A0A2V3PMY1_9BACT|nr:NAD(P)-dependent oxidoreductase [Dysgonomonas alginatilytica]PXV62180.1 3-hydroxyisobutyrate dehydrogenase [Dysgonomonas alginatilytica]
MPTPKLTFIGLGHMGTPMALNLLKAGFELSVYNRSADKTKPLTDAGAKAYTSLDEVRENSNVIFTMLADDAAVSSVFADLLKGSVSEKLFINMSTISSELTKRLSVEIESKGGYYLEAPVSGSVKPAVDGTLIILAAGREPDYEFATTYFEKLGKFSIYLGEVGQGAKAKLAINYYMSVVIEGLAETVLFAEKNGIDKETMMFIVNESACGSPMSKMKTPSIVQDNYPAAFPLKHMDKDIRLAQAEGLNTETSEAMKNIYQEAMQAKLGDDDLMAVLRAVKTKYFK